MSNCNPEKKKKINQSNKYKYICVGLQHALIMIITKT